MTEGQKLDRDLVAVLFPGIVKNDNKAIECLGGIRNISRVYSQSNKNRLGLSFHPENPFLKKTYANAKKAAGVLLKVKVKKVKDGDEIKREVISTSVVGAVKIIYRFESMCDFQYLPVHRDTPKEPLKCIWDQIIPSGLDHINSLSEPAPSFLPPPIYTRFEKPIWYSYTDKKCTEKISDEDGESVHNKLRSLRGALVPPYVFNLTDEMPTEACEILIKQKAAKQEIYPWIAQDYEKVMKMFQERPIWSLNLIKFHTKIRLVYLKVIMPCVGLYMKTGPWRSMWVRFGYDPRKEPGARIYQTLDFRLRYNEGIRSMILSSETSINVPNVERPTKRKRGNTVAEYEVVAESSVYFNTDTIPTQRHIFYQYCDVKLPEVEELLAVEPPPGYLCHPKHGWLAPNTDEVCRDHMSRYVKQTMLATNSAIKFEDGDGGSDSDSDTDDEGPPNEIEEE